MSLPPPLRDDLHPQPPAAAFDECARLVEAEDPDRATAVAFAPPEARPFLNALYAFNIETARVRDVVSQPLPGEIRLQWWRDRIEAAEDGGQGHPVAEALLATVRRFDLPREAFARFLEARIFDLYDDPMPGRQEFEAYAGDTAGALIMFAAMVLDRAAAPAAAEAAGHAGVAQLAAGMLRLLPRHRSRGQVFIPEDILAACGCSREALIAGEPEPVERAVAAMSAYAREHVAAYRAARGAVPTSLRAAFLPAELTEAHLRRLGRRPAEEAGRPINPLRRSFLYWQAMRR